jgi:hypothetical protein
MLTQFEKVFWLREHVGEYVRMKRSKSKHGIKYFNNTELFRFIKIITPEDQYVIKPSIRSEYPRIDIKTDRNLSAKDLRWCPNLLSIYPNSKKEVYVKYLRYWSLKDEIRKEVMHQFDTLIDDTFDYYMQKNRGTLPTRLNRLLSFFQRHTTWHDAYLIR